MRQPGKVLAGPPPVCPRCHQNDRVEKVSAIYLENLSGKQPRRSANTGEVPPPLTRMSPQEVHSLGSRLAPPAAPTRVQVRPVHPDLIVVVFTAVLPIFVAGIARSQPGVLLPTLAFLILIYGLYILARPRLLERFARQQAERQAEAQRYQKAIGAWMRLYYCARDEALFFPGSSRTAPLEEVGSLLFGEGRGP